MLCKTKVQCGANFACLHTACLHTAGMYSAAAWQQAVFQCQVGTLDTSATIIAFQQLCGWRQQSAFSQRRPLVLQALLLARIEAQMDGNKELASRLLIPAALQDEAVRCTPHQPLPPLFSFCCTAAICCQIYILRGLI